MGQFDLGNDGDQLLLETAVAPHRVLLLAGLLILAAEDEHVVVSVRLDSKKSVRIRGVPPESVGHDSVRDAPSDHVAGVHASLV
jgi:hypothetical protein